MTIHNPLPKSNHFWRWSGYINLTCQISGHYSHAFSRKCPEFGNLTCYTQSKCPQNEENQQKISDQNLIRSGGGQATSACQISCHSKWLQQNSCQESTLSLMLPQTLSEKAQFKRFAKNRKLQFWPNPEFMLRKPFRGIIIENSKWLQ